MRRASNLAVAIASLIASSPAAAFEQMKTRAGMPLLWQKMPLQYSVVFALREAEGEARSASARSAFDRWSFAPNTSAGGVYVGPTETATPGDGLSTIVFQSAWPRDFGEVNRAVAFTELTYDVRTGTITDGDVHLNAQGFRFASTPSSGVFDSESVIVHELGHVFGLGHSCGDPGTSQPSCFSIEDDPPGTRDRILGAVMAPGLATGVIRRTLNADDLAGIAAAYPGPRSAAAFRFAGADFSCESMRWLVNGEGLASLSFELRYADGTVASIEPIVRSDDHLELAGSAIALDRGTVDLLARDPVSGASVIDLVDPPNCPENPAPKEDPETGCSCDTTPASNLWSMMLLFVASRRRR